MRPSIVYDRYEESNGPPEQEDQDYYVENYYVASDPEETRHALAIMRAAEAAYNSVETPAGFGFGQVRFHPSKEYVIPADTVEFDISRASFIGGRGTRIRTEDTTGTAILITATLNRTEGTASFAGMGSKVEGIALYGPEFVNDNPPELGLKGWQLDVPTPNADVAHTSFNNVLTRGFSLGWSIEDNSHQINWNDCFTIFNVFGFYVPFGHVNMGERLTFKGGSFGGNCIHIVNNAADIHLYGVSLDYTDPGGRLNVSGGDPLEPKRRAIANFKGRTFMHGGHIEDDNDEDYWISSAAPDSYVSLNGVQLHNGASLKGNFPFFLSEAGTGDPDRESLMGGIHLGSGCHFHHKANAVYLQPTYCGGDGRFSVESNMGVLILDAFGVSTPRAAWSRSLNVIHPHVDTDDYLEQFNTSFSTGIVNVIGDEEIEFISDEDEDPWIELEIPIRPGQVLYGSWQRRFTKNSSSGGFVFLFNMLGKEGEVLPVYLAADHTYHVTVNEPTYELQGLLPMLAPPGAVSVKFLCGISGSDTPDLGYLKELNLNVV